MEKVFIKILAVTTVVILFSGCQATPEQPVVVQKDMEQMIEQGVGEDAPAQTEQQQKPEQTAAEPKISYAELCEHYGVPEQFQTTITQGNLTINCDVKIDLPDILQLPMARVQAGRFSQEQVYTFFHSLCGDTPMYLSPKQADKAYYLREILECQRKIAALTNEEMVSHLKERIVELKKDYENAPEDIELIEADGTLEIRKLNDNTETISGSFTRFYASSAPFEHNAMIFSVQNDSEYKKDGAYSFLDEEGNTQIVAPWSCSRLEFEREGRYTDFGTGRQGRKLKDVTELSLSGGAVADCMLNVTPQHARETVEALISEVGIDDMVIDSVSLYSSKQEMPPDIIEHLKKEGRYIEDTTPETQAYVFRLLRQVSGVSVESVARWSSQSSVDGMDVGKEWSYEMLEIAVDDKGIANICWEAPLDIQETMTEHTVIIPWSDVQGVFEKMIVIQHANNINKDDRTVIIDITQVSLSLRRIMERDSYATGLLVPVWNFFGTITSRKGQAEPHSSEYDNYPLIIINAIDGSVIDIGKGY